MLLRLIHTETETCRALSGTEGIYSASSAHYISLQPRCITNLVPMQGRFQSNDMDTQTPA